MNLTSAKKFKIVTKLAKKVVSKGENDGFLFLKTYIEEEKQNEVLYEGIDQQPIYFSYKDISNCIHKLNNKTIIEMYKDEFSEEAKKEFSEERKSSYYLPTDKLVLFFSHSHKDVDKIIRLKDILEKTNWIECFVAPKNIELSEEWEKEVKKYLECCHCLIAFLSKEFKSSSYCDQEVGFVVHRDIPIFQFTLDKTDSYGFIKHLQSKPFKDPINSANQIEKYILNPEKQLYQIAQSKIKTAVETLKNNFLNSTNIKMAESVYDQLIGFKTGQIEASAISDIQKNWKHNSKIKEVEGIESKMEEFFKKHPQKESKNKKDPHQKV